MSAPPPPNGADLATAPLPTAVPRDLLNQIHELEKWALANERDAARDRYAFWALKAPAIAGAASAALWTQLGWTTAGVIVGMLSSIAVLIDGVHPRGMLRNTHLRALHDLRMLTNRMTGQWRSLNTEARTETAEKAIIRDAERERQRIAKYVRDAETALKPQ